MPELLADLPEISPDGLTYTLRLREGPRFHPDACLEDQARPLRAGDVAASLLRITPGKHATWSLLAGRVAGLDAWHAAAAKNTPGQLAPITWDDAARTVTLRLTRPQPEFAAILAHPALAIVPPECVTYYDGKTDGRPSFARHPVGSGPYHFDHAASEFPRTAVLVAEGEPRAYPRAANSPVPCPQVPGARRVVLTHFQHGEPALRAFQAGELAAIVPGQAQFAEVVALGEPVPGALPPGTGLKKFPVAAVDLLYFNMASPEIGHHPDPARARENLALRRAIARAFDVPRYLEVVRNGAWADASAGVLPREVSPRLDLPDAPPARDLAAAQAILAEAGLSERTWTLNYWGGASEPERQEAALVREFLRPLGVDLQITARDNFLYDPGLRAGAHLFGLRFDADFFDPSNTLASFTCRAPDNLAGFCAPEYDAAYAAFAALPAGPARDDAARGLQALLGEHMPVRPLDQPSAWYLHQRWLGGLVRHPLAGLRVELLCPDMP
ncbi:ABC transporter substrate-binding protein [Nannocystis pusilla]|uniref:ABC transporter substrate-binding protein n=1 Tax=Nannocystis pusilla TaxID=889268 RepID=A0ABS7TUZ0_9BACT|nr:ABC transporter substrate-binding protein [Nannocystis pusilla]